jgi:hypothetical protein
MGADLVHNLGDGEGSEILLKEKCLDDVVSRLGERLKDFPNDFLLRKVSNIENIDTLEFFLFYIFPLFCKNIWSVKKFAKLYIWRHGGRWQGPTVVPHGVRRRTVL